MNWARKISERIERLSFRTKIGLATIAACAATALIACIAFIINESLTYRLRFDREQETLSELLAANVTAAVLFGDNVSATDILSATRLTPQVDAVVVNTPDGEVFASYGDLGSIQVGAEGRYSQVTPHNGPVYVSAIDIDNEVIGHLILFTNLSDLEKTIWRYSLIAFFVFLGSTLFAILFARWESRAMTTPMLQLRRTIQAIRGTRDYSSRVPPSLDRDFGRLIDSFNAMLVEIESRDERLESLVGDLITARDAAQSANTAKSQFLANMSHELRTPLNAIINYAEIIQEDLEEGGDEQTLSDVSKIQGAGLHLLELINGILDLSKIEAGKMDVEAHPFDVGSIIREAADTVRPAAERNGNQLVVEIAPDVGAAVTDSFKLRQCVLNILSNACKFTSNGDVKLALRLDEATDSIVIAVSDTGIGMNDSQMKSLFQAFVQADTSTTRKYGGTGLGLTITQRLISLLGGRIEVTSTMGEGSCFTLIVPREFSSSENDQAAPRESSATLQQPAGAGRTALIVDDDPSARELMGRLASRLNYSTVLAEDGEQALRLARSEKPSVVLLDLHMPVVDGWTVLQRMRADPELRSIPTIVVSVDDDAQACYRLGAEDYLTKPVNRVELERALLSYSKLASGDILIVEDNEAAADLVARAAKNVGFEPVIAKNAEEALSLLNESKVVGIILDLGLPGMSGFELLDNLRAIEQRKDIPVIVFSAQELTADELASIEQKAQGYHVKSMTSPRKVISELMSKSAVSTAARPDDAEEGEERCAS